MLQPCACRWFFLCGLCVVRRQRQGRRFHTKLIPAHPVVNTDAEMMFPAITPARAALLTGEQPSKLTSSLST